MITIRKMLSDDEIELTYLVMNQLRNHLSQQQYTAAVKRQQKIAGYELVALLEGDEVRCVAGYRISECLAWGKFLYVDDLVTNAGSRSKSCGRQIMQWLLDEAGRNGCKELHLDSGVQRHRAHRFYLRERMDITAYHFALKLCAPAS
jgi:GNAT superfamily N-acetyltransferase